MPQQYAPMMHHQNVRGYIPPHMMQPQFFPIPNQPFINPQFYPQQYAYPMPHQPMSMVVPPQMMPQHMPPPQHLNAAAALVHSQQQQQQSSAAAPAATNASGKSSAPLLASPAPANAGAPTTAAAAVTAAAASTPAKKETTGAAPSATTSAAASTPAPASTTTTTATPSKSDDTTKSSPTTPAVPSFAAAVAAANAAAATAAPAATTATNTATSTTTDKSAAAASFGVKAVATYKPKPASERERKPKKADDDEQDLKEVRLRANSSATAADEDAASKPATTTTTATAPTTSGAPIPAPIATPAAAPTAASAAAPSTPLASPGSRKQSVAEAESSLASAITSSSVAGALQYNRDYLLRFKSDATVPLDEKALALIETISKSTESGSFDGLRPGGGLQPGKKLGPGSGGSSRIPRNAVGGSGSGASAVPVGAGAGQTIRAGFGTAVQQNRNQAGGKQQGGGNRRPRVDQPMDIEIVPLAKTDNGYRKIDNIPADLKVIRQLNAILNKLTPEKFDILVEEVMNLEITTPALLRDVVTTVFEKALAEPNYSPVYAEFSLKLSARLPSFPADESDTQNTHNFKRLVLNQCQREFENQDGAIGEDGQLAPGRITAEAFAALSEEGKEEHLAKLKRRTLGTIRFIGELFVRAMLVTKIMRGCIALLVGDAEAPNEENIEALCKLLETVGKLMDTKPSDIEFLDKVFGEFETLAQPPSKEDRTRTEAGRPVLSSRIRFMIQDTIELRKRNWVSKRKNEVQAKKISEVHKENAAAQAAASSGSQDARSSSSSSQRPTMSLNVGGSRFGKKQDRYAINGPASPSPRAGSSAKQADDGWETAKGSGKRSGDVRMTQMSRTNSTGSQSGSVATPRTSGGGSGSATPQRQRGGDKSDKPKASEDGKNNAFALLNAGGEEDEEDATRSSQRDEDEQDDNGDDEQGEDDDNGEDAPQLSRDEIQSKAKSFIKEYYTSDLLNEVELSIKAIGGRSALSDEIISDAILIAIEGKDLDRKQLAKLIPFLVQKNYVSTETVEQGFNFVLEQSEDLGVDLPRLIEQVAATVAQLIQDGIFSFAVLESFAKPITSTDDQVKFATFVLANLKKSMEEAKFIDMVKESGLKWKDIAGDSLADEQAKKHLTTKGLEMLTPILL